MDAVAVYPPSVLMASSAAGGDVEKRVPGGESVFYTDVRLSKGRPLPDGRLYFVSLLSLGLRRVRAFMNYDRVQKWCGRTSLALVSVSLKIASVHTYPRACVLAEWQATSRL